MAEPADPPENAEGPESAKPPESPDATHGRHELPPDTPVPARGGRTQLVFGALGVLLCMLLGVAIVTQVRQTGSGDSLETARPADLLVLLDSLQQREGALNAEVNDLRQTLNSMQASGSSDQAAIENAQARLAALSILIGTVPATGPGVIITIDDQARGVSPETMLDVVNELRAAGAEAMELRGAGTGGQERSDPGNVTGGQERSDPGSGAGGQEVRVGVDTWMIGAPGALIADGVTLSPPYSVLAIGDPPTLAAAMNIPGGAMDSVKRVGGTMTASQSDIVEVTALRQPKPRQYAQPVK